MGNNTIAVVGGAYGEECSYPRNKVAYRGSGGRASTFLSCIGVETIFHTILSESLLPKFKRISKTYGFSLQYQSKDSDIWFRYRHPLSKPNIYHQSLTTSKLEKIDANFALVFGMLEGRPQVTAKKVVYDPQNGSNSEHFEDNNSTAEELALLVSLSEGQALTNQVIPEEIAKSLIARKHVSVVIIKCGPQGALVKTKNEEEWIKPFVTNKVYKIGSGDIFSAAFAYSWLIKGFCPFTAAWFASKATATYVESGTDLFEIETIEKLEINAAKDRLSFKGLKARDIPNTQIYLAGPFFDTSEQWLIDEAREALTEMGFKVFSPIHDIGTGSPNEVASQDLFALEKSGVVFALLDGMDPGTVFEVGYARALGIPVIAVAETSHEKDLTMILGSGCEVANDFTTGIYATCWYLMGDV